VKYLEEFDVSNLIKSVSLSLTDIDSQLSTKPEAYVI
jgi:hypothetical protein